LKFRWQIYSLLIAFLSLWQSDFLCFITVFRKTITNLLNFVYVISIDLHTQRFNILIMKKIFLISSLVAIAFASCTKEDCSDNTTQAPAAQIATLDSILASKSISATKDARGFRYNIIAAGGADKPNKCNSIVVKYTGKLMDGTTFDENKTGTTFLLGNLITGWQQALPLIGKTGKINIWLPPSLGYGEAGSGAIPKNANLYFEMELVDF
jgi:FKBP-type peptidyl-prolyl cis-trans isomerase FkpA